MIKCNVINHKIYKVLLRPSVYCLDKSVQRRTVKMAYLNKEYKFSHSENFDGFLRSLDLPEDKIKNAEFFKPTVKLVKNDDGTYTNFSTFNGKTTETKFTPGVEFDDTVGEENVPIKSLFTVEGDVVTRINKSDLGIATFRMEYNGDLQTVVITGDKFDGVAKIYYKA